MNVKSNGISLLFDPLSYSAGYEILNGTAVQSYDEGTGEYAPSRASLPLVVLPYVHSIDESGGELTGPCELSEVTCHVEMGTERIEIGYDAAAGISSIVRDRTDADFPDAPKWAIVFKSDIPPESPATMYITAKTIDKNDGMEKSFNMYLVLTTNTSNTGTMELVDVLAGEQDRNMTVDPVRTTEETMTLSVQLRSSKAGGRVVEDSDVRYVWEMQQDGAWTRITDDNQVFVKEFADADNTYGKTISLLIALFDNVKLRVGAAYLPAYKGGKPYTADERYGYVYYSVRRNPTQDVNGEVVADGTKVTPDAQITRTMKLTDSQGDLTSEQLNAHYRVDWYRFIGTAANKVFIERGESMSRKAEKLGLTSKNRVSLAPVVSRLQCWKPIIANNKTITFNGMVVAGHNAEPIL